MVNCSSLASMWARPPLHGEEEVTTVARLEDISSQPCGWYCIDGHVRRADGIVSIAVRIFDPGACPPGACERTVAPMPEAPLRPGWRLRESECQYSSIVRRLISLEPQHCRHE